MGSISVFGVVVGSVIIFFIGCVIYFAIKDKKARKAELEAKAQYRRRVDNVFTAIQRVFGEQGIPFKFEWYKDYYSNRLKASSDALSASGVYLSVHESVIAYTFDLLLTRPGGDLSVDRVYDFFHKVIDDIVDLKYEEFNKGGMIRVAIEDIEAIGLELFAQRLYQKLALYEKVWIAVGVFREEMLMDERRYQEMRRIVENNVRNVGDRLKDRSQAS